jgi:Tyrosine phosphatase family
VTPVDSLTVVTTFAERLVRFDACFNFRDLGGYQTDVGRRVRWKTLYRGDTLHRLDGSDLELLLELGCGPSSISGPTTSWTTTVVSATRAARWSCTTCP